MNLNSTSNKTQNDAKLEYFTHLSTQVNKGFTLSRDNNNATRYSCVEEIPGYALDEDEGIPLSPSESKAIWLVILTALIILGLIIYMFL